MFPAIEAAHPDLSPVLRQLEADHQLIAGLLENLGDSMNHPASSRELERHLDGIAAIMESHFAYEERQLLTVLEGLHLSATTAEALGPGTSMTSGPA